MKLEEFLRLLRGVSQKSGYYMAKCPAHDDKKASLSITKGMMEKYYFIAMLGAQLKAYASR